MSQTSGNHHPEQWNSVTSRRRKQHLRVFTGCATCRQRHVKCDEHSPSCMNCSRLSLCCDYSRKFSFKITLPDDYRLSSEGRLRDENGANDVEEAEEEGHQLWSHMAAISPDASTSSISELPEVSTPGMPPGLTWASEDLDDPETVDASASSSYTMALPRTSALSVHSVLYYDRFLTTVSTMLIIYDTPSNSNPFRSFPQLAGSSGLLQHAMIALGAQHLANIPGTQDRYCHNRAAMDAYAEAITQLKGISPPINASSQLEILATILLLCIFDQMSSTGSRWKIHLAGACELFESMYRPRVAMADEGMVMDSQSKLFITSMRRFLASLLSYLDVAAACATGEGTLIPGDYWERFGGWEYNLGVPSFHLGNSGADRVLSQLRHSWSRIMSIQADISRFAKMQRNWLSDDQREMFQADLAQRIKNWHNSAPSIYAWLSQLDQIPLGSTDRVHEILIAAACIRSYACACVIYLRMVATQRLCTPSTDPDLKLPVEETLRMCLNFSNGLNRMAILWPLFTAGAASADECQQSLVRESLLAMQCFGFKVC